jgi:type II secretory pathway pseudopilin PulG
MRVPVGRAFAQQHVIAVHPVTVNRLSAETCLRRRARRAILSGIGWRARIGIADEKCQSEAGFTLIDMMFTCALIGLLSTLAMPGLLRAKNVAQAASAITTLRVINSAQVSYAVTCGSGFYSPDLQTLGAAPPGSFQAFLGPEESAAASFIRSGYTFTMTGASVGGTPASCNGLAAGMGAPGYSAAADPLDTKANTQFYGTNAEGTIYSDAVTFNGSMPPSGPATHGASLK